MTYRVLTWDTESQDFTPQDGVDEYVRGFCGLRNAIRQLRECGYTAHRRKSWGDNDPMVLIEKVFGSIV